MADREEDIWRLWWHPLPLGAVLITAVNDHMLKALWPGWWTGKLSDFAGLFYFPLFVTLIVYLAARAARRPLQARAVLIASAAATGSLFAAVKLLPPVRNAVAVIVGHMLFSKRISITPDTSDLIALGVIPLSVAWGLWRLNPAPAGMSENDNALGAES